MGHLFRFEFRLKGYAQPMLGCGLFAAGFHHSVYSRIHGTAGLTKQRRDGFAAQPVQKTGLAVMRYDKSDIIYYSHEISIFPSVSTPGRKYRILAKPW